MQRPARGKLLLVAAIGWATRRREKREEVEGRKVKVERGFILRSSELRGIARASRDKERLPSYSGGGLLLVPFLSEGCT
jgi:hypothetical protein